MTAAEKADIIYFAMLNLSKGMISEYLARQQAIWFTHEVINFINDMPLQDATRSFRKEQDIYWNEVLTHLKK